MSYRASLSHPQGRGTECPVILGGVLWFPEAVTYWCSEIVIGCGMMPQPESGITPVGLASDGRFGFGFGFLVRGHEPGQRGHQSARVVVLWVGEYLFGRAAFHDLALVKNGNAVANARHGCKIMRNVENRHSG